ncbi:CoA-transferase subunit beta [Rhodoligotrophos defluvii]|uniref:CoA-transferase subunit beta n=1 Tax=Rhodoligotrophos defluvii TaxID=2561934 RepID=UPI0010CA0AA8|nr:CoA-transferase [Rhodoligotrophos defluvii]
MSTLPGFTTNELAACIIAREIKDDDLIFVGVGTNGRAFTLAVGIPLTASRLAQLRHAPGATVYWGNLLDPDLSRMPDNLRQDSLTRWPAAACPADTAFKCDMLARSRFDVSFESAAQVDRYGNLNITAIGDYARPDVRLVGSLAQPEHLAFVRRPIIIVDLNRRTFVEQVDFVTSVGHRVRGTPRGEFGLRGPGPALVVTDNAIFDFGGDGGMRLRSLHPSITLEDVLAQMSFAPEIPPHVPVTATPDAEELRLMREVIDPRGVMMRV